MKCAMYIDMEKGIMLACLPFPQVQCGWIIKPTSKRTQRDHDYNQSSLLIDGVFSIIQPAHAPQNLELPHTLEMTMKGYGRIIALSR